LVRCLPTSTCFNPKKRGDFVLIDLTADGGAAAKDGLDRADHLRMALQRTPDSKAHDERVRGINGVSINVWMILIGSLSRCRACRW